MPVQLKSTAHKLHGGFINKSMIRQMVDYYRDNRRKDQKSLKFAHFTVTEIIELLVANGIIEQQSGRSDVSQYGIKIYLANHADDPNTCPGNRQTTYLVSDTAIICNTKLSGNTFVDMLDDLQYISLPGENKGIDKGGICPPDCPKVLDPDNHDSEDISIRN